ncbi:MAG: hypothetical protein ISS19_14525 [Bacteroidales bacterium]|nr:hypothetical protein [Bacteroidales bacterium]
MKKYDIQGETNRTRVMFAIKTNTVPGTFPGIINDNHRFGYAFACSVRTGLQYDDQTFQERYAFYFDTCKAVLLHQPVVFPDTAGDDFVREPYLAHFRAREGSFFFGLITIHTSPHEALHEIGKLHDVVQYFLSPFIHI